MGHSHHWEQPVEMDRVTFMKVATDLRRIMPELVRREPGLTGIEGYHHPVVENAIIAFTKGKHNWFAVPCCMDDRVYRLDKGQTRKWQHIKTMFDKTYELAIFSALLVFKHHFGDAFVITSEGTIEDWKPAIDLVNEQLSYSAEWEFRKGKDGKTLERKEAA